jgi:hypothetical protein
LSSKPKLLGDLEDRPIDRAEEEEDKVAAMPVLEPNIGVDEGVEDLAEIYVWTMVLGIYMFGQQTEVEVAWERTYCIFSPLFLDYSS